jgi:hypothetical protein
MNIYYLKPFKISSIMKKDKNTFELRNLKILATFTDSCVLLLMITSPLARTTLLALIMAGGLCPALALDQQAPAPNTSLNHQKQGPDKGPMSFLTPVEKQQIMKARGQAIAKDPSLKAEHEELMKKRQSLQGNANVDPASRSQMMQALKAHEKKMRAAMLAEDPTLTPIMAKLDKKQQEMRQQKGPPGEKSTQ